MFSVNRMKMKRMIRIVDMPKWRGKCLCQMTGKALNLNLRRTADGSVGKNYLGRQAMKMTWTKLLSFLVQVEMPALNLTKICLLKQRHSDLHPVCPTCPPHQHQRANSKHSNSGKE